VVLISLPFSVYAVLFVPCSHSISVLCTHQPHHNEWTHINYKVAMPSKVLDATAASVSDLSKAPGA
jgi:hypothetical protein